MGLRETFVPRKTRKGSADMYETILFDRQAGVATITLNREKALNSFNLKLHEEVYAALEAAAGDDAVRCIVLRGRGRAFSTGADLRSVTEVEESPDLGTYLRETYSRLVLRMAEVEKPILGVLHGPVYGAGLGIALACDLRVAAESARFSMAFVRIGLMPDAGSSFFLPRIVGLGRAMEIAMLGEELDATEAHRVGLVNRVVPDGELDAAVRELTTRLANGPTVALGWIKKSLYASFESDLTTALETEATGQAVCGNTRDFGEGVAAFLEKRRPEYTGR
jgi:2-(1,2-epoxy-1,2-dihydrophenyl)acetyl-CoA isomerase